MSDTRLERYGPVIMGQDDMSDKWTGREYWEGRLEALEKAFGGKNALKAGIVVLEARGAFGEIEKPPALVVGYASSRKVHIELRAVEDSEALRHHTTRLLDWLNHKTSWYRREVRYIDQSAFLAEFYSEALEESAKQYFDDGRRRNWFDPEGVADIGPIPFYVV